jgi:hypothetical protein
MTTTLVNMLHQTQLRQTQTLVKGLFVMKRGEVPLTAP